ncbi:MAG: MFS transporter [Desulfobacteraceae bacterium]|nr:MFS transporter [Desulfobacteraceae bacterium]
MNIWLILIAFTLHFTRHGIVFPFIPLLAERMGAGPSTIGFVVGAFSLVAVFLSIPLGGLVDRFGVKRLLLFGVICNILNAVILIHTDTILELIISQLIAGIGFLLLVIASQAFFSRLPDSSRREKGFGWLSFGAAAGQSVGPILGGVLVDRFDYQAAFWVVLALSSAGLVLLGLKDTKESKSTKSSYNMIQDARQAGVLAMDSRMLMILIFTFAIVFAANLRASFLPVLLRTEGLTEIGVGFLISLFSVMSTSIRLIFGRLLDIFDRKKILAVSMLAVIVAVGLLPWMFSVAGFAILISIFGLGFGMTQPLSMVMTADLTDPNESGLAMGLRFTAIMVGGLLSPIFLGFIIGTFGLRPGFYFSALVVVLAGIHMFIIRPDLIPGRRRY